MKKIWRGWKRNGKNSIRMTHDTIPEDALLMNDNNQQSVLGVINEKQTLYLEIKSVLYPLIYPQKAPSISERGCFRMLSFVSRIC